MRLLLICPARALTEQVIVENDCVPVGIMGNAAMNTIQPFSLRNNTNRHDKLNDNTSNTSLRDQGTRNHRARMGKLDHLRGRGNREDTLFRFAGDICR